MHAFTYIFQNEKLRQEIMDGNEIQHKITSSISYKKLSFHYFINQKMIVRDEMHNGYDFVNGYFPMSCYTAMDIFETTKYGDKKLIDLFRKKFRAPIIILTECDILKNVYCVFVHWCIKKKSNSSCSIL